MLEIMPKQLISLESPGIISKQPIKAEISSNEKQGIRFIMPKGTIIEANISNLNSTQRNTVLSKNGEFLCLTEHFLAAAALCNVNDIDVKLNGEELPFGDGSSKLWIDFFEENKLSNKLSNSSLELKESIEVNSGDRSIKAIASDKFQATYKLDWNHPLIGKQDYTWTIGEDPKELALARTFASEDENKMLGLSGWNVGLTQDGFTQELIYQDEPARHKALDLIGDLHLAGINPLKIKMHVISNKGGHELNSKLCTKLYEQFSK